MWVTSAPLEVEAAQAALRASVPDLDDAIARGQIDFLPHDRWYLRDGRFSADEVLAGWVERLAAARARGFEGLRLSGNTFWLEAEDWQDFTRYEASVNSVIGQHRMLALCTYSLTKCSASEVLDVVANHQFALAKRAGRWECIEGSANKQMEAALRESEEKYRSIVETAEEGIVIGSLEGRVPVRQPEDGGHARLLARGTRGSQRSRLPCGGTAGGGAPGEGRTEARPGGQP